MSKGVFKAISLLIVFKMTEYRKNQILEQFRRPPGNKTSRSRDIKHRLYHLRGKETFLTDTQNSDYTKSSGEINVPRTQQLEETIRRLQKENSELRQHIVELKASHCFEINEEKLKNMIKETDSLRLEVEITRKELDQSLVQRDFLERFNKNLKAQCETLTKEILMLKSSSPEPRKDKNIYTTREDDNGSKSSRNSSNEFGLSSKRRQYMQWKKEKEDTAGTLLKGSLSASRLHQDYYGGGRSNRSKHYKKS